MAIKLGIVGIGVIARAQHLPVLAASDDFRLIAAASRHAQVDGVRTFTSLAQMLEATPEVEAVSLCTPPATRAADARLALEAGKHVLLEKPPGATQSEVQALAARATEKGVTLNASWHSRHAPGVAQAKAWLARRRVALVEIEWREDVRHWHPGQDWIFAPGGLGVFDPGINALSIVTHILPLPFALQSAKLAFPENRQAPIAADLVFKDTGGAPIRAAFDFLQAGPQTWEIRIATEDGEHLTLKDGGAVLQINGAAIAPPAGLDPLRAEYAGVYAEFRALIARRACGVDLAPLRHVADAFMLGERVHAPAFDF